MRGNRETPPYFLKECLSKRAWSGCAPFVFDPPIACTRVFMVDFVPQKIAHTEQKWHPSLEDQLARLAIEFIAKPNETAVQIFNDLAREKRLGAGFHLTC